MQLRLQIRTFAILMAIAGCVRLAQTQQPAPPAAPSSPRAFLDQYCVACHSEKLKTGGLALQSIDVAARLASSRLTRGAA
jgi:cytochrome c551/c552